MKLATLFGVATLLVTASAFAHDLTYLGPIKSRETKTVKVELPAGKLTVEVSSSNLDTKFNCQFSSGYGGVTFEQNNATRCVSSVTTQSDTTMVVTVTNLGKDSDYKIWVHDSK